MKDLIGLKFKRNVYGLTNWTSTVKETFVSWDIVQEGFKPRIMIKSDKGIFYNIEELIFVET